MTITLRQESATGATTKGSALTYQELDNNFIHLLRQGSVVVRADSGTEQTLGEADKDSILQVVGGTNISTAISSDSAGETVLTLNYTGGVGITDINAGTGISVVADSAGGVTISNTASDNNTTYSIAAVADGSDANLVLTGSDASTDAIQFVAGTGISISVDSAGSIQIQSTGTGIANVVEDTTPQLGGNLDVNGQSIVSVSNGNIVLLPNGTGQVVLDGTYWPTNLGGVNNFLKTDGSGNASWAFAMINLVDDTSPQLGGALDCQGNDVRDATLEDYKETIHSLGSTDSPTITISNGNVQSVTISSGLSLPAFSDAAAGQSVTLLVTGSGTASGTGAYKFAGGNTTLTSYSVVSIFYDGSTYWTSIATDFQ